MKLGIISDSHDNLPKIEKAVRIFNREKVALVLHAGDYVAPFSLAPLEKLNCDYLGVFGNNDGEKEGLSKKSGGRIKEGPVVLEKENKKILLIHDIQKSETRIDTFDLVVFGHSHKAEIKKENNILSVNPGECGGWLFGKSTAAVVDLSSMSAKIINL